MEMETAMSDLEWDSDEGSPDAHRFANQPEPKVTAQQRDEAEWLQWLRICERLERAGAVTSADLTAARSVSPTTPGQQLLHDIWTWGDRRVEIEKRHHD